MRLLNLFFKTKLFKKRYPTGGNSLSFKIRLSEKQVNYIETKQSFHVYSVNRATGEVILTEDLWLGFPEEINNE